MCGYNRTAYTSYIVIDVRVEIPPSPELFQFFPSSPLMGISRGAQVPQNRYRGFKVKNVYIYISKVERKNPLQQT